MSDVARARGLAAHRRERRLGAFRRHEIMSVKMATNSANHHSAQRQIVLYVNTGTQTCTWTYMDSEKESPDCYLSGNKSPALVFTYAAPSPVTHHLHLQRLNLRRPLPVIECETPARFICPLAPVIEHVSATPDDSSASNRDFLVLVNPQFRTSCEQNTLTRHISSCFTSLVSMSHMTIGSRLKAQGCPHHVIHASCAVFVLFSLRLSTLHSSPSLSSSFSLSWSSSSSSMWVGSGRSTLCASANEELGTSADNNPLTLLVTPTSKFFGLRLQSERIEEQIGNIPVSPSV